MKLLKLSVVLASLVLAAACEDDPVGGERTELRLSADTTYIVSQETVQVTAVVGDAASTVAAYRSLNEAVATVSATGLVTGRSVGVARIVAETGRLADTIQIHVTPSPRRAVATGYSHTCVLDVAGQAHCWGLNAAGQLGNGTTASSAAPVAVVGGRTFEMIEAADSTTCGVTTAGEGYCWGAGGFGQLGNGSQQSSASPVKIAAPQPLASIAVGVDVACALARDGTAYCWGRNVNGNVGNGDRVLVSTPVAVNTPLKFTQISVGYYQSCALTSDGSAYCWGRNVFRALGTGDTLDRLTPAAVEGGLRYSSLAAGSLTTCAVSISLGREGAYCWGTNFFGSLGVGHQGTRAGEGVVPTRVVDAEMFSQVSAGEENNVRTPNCHLTPQGQAYCLGGNQYGQLGTSDTTERCQLNTNSEFFACASRPLPVSGGLTFDMVDPGAEFVCGLTPDGRLFCWGDNEFGQLGTFSGALSFAPVRSAESLRLP